MRLKIYALLLAMAAALPCLAAPPGPEATMAAVTVAPPSDIKAADTPNDAGNAITVTWQASPDEAQKLIEGYEVLRSETPDGEFIKVGYVPYGFTSFDDQDVPANSQDYFYQVKAVGRESQALSLVSVSARSVEQWFNTMRINALISCILFTMIVMIFIGRAKSGQSLFIRRIAGLSEVEEAVGRATEMGRPILYVPGLSGISDVATIAALNILGQVAKKTAEYGTPLLVPNRDPVVFTVAQEIVKEAYNEIGRPDAYNHDSVFYLTDSQMGFASGVDGIMTREKPATNFFMGMFWAESLILAETGAATGAIQIAGTDSISQLPFFITACDYTLIGEELYAASAYLSREPMLLGTLKGQDWSKAVIVMLLIVGLAISLISPGVRQIILQMLKVG
ncbi:MAG: fibronectin type III domain-containing protein [Candidatus Edwardsbacteria bacterium]|nr:fibronectin type III domain-containing protein [Candidatus Edwardsbacteria bacterium]MBU1577529.1 fibronectin type III domain-containing protein [Candidatus Edwardsbacteria bacterium]MBU2463434.1 fibronectin type III domain-containing protein [Candidatus Edwardsbacteria bacterium]MBU2593624.1 fibronectin type III domain-containing protein [Candidatus Edwardsbacteria bacterium]